MDQNITQQEFIDHYVKIINKINKHDPYCHFIIGDNNDCDLLSNEYLKLINKLAIVCNLSKKITLINIKLISNYHLIL